MSQEKKTSSQIAIIAAEARASILAAEISALKGISNAQALVGEKQAELDSVIDEISQLKNDSQQEKPDQKHNQDEGKDQSGQEDKKAESQTSVDVSAKDGMIINITVNSSRKPSAKTGAEKKSEYPHAIKIAAKAAIKDMLDSTGGTDHKVDDPKFKADLNDYYQGAQEELANGGKISRSDFIEFMKANGHDIPSEPVEGTDAAYGLVKTELEDGTHISGVKDDIENGEVKGHSVFSGEKPFQLGVKEASASLLIGDFNKVAKDFSLAHKFTPDSLTFAPEQESGQGQGTDLSSQKL